MTVLPSLVYEKLPSIVRLECLFLFFTVAAADQSGALSFPSFNIGSGLINLAALTALIGSSTVESLVLGSRGTAGLPWAAMSSFGVISVVKASLTGLSPAWLRETLGVRSALSDSFLGMSLDLRRDWRGETRIRRQIGQAAGVLCKRRANASSKDHADHGKVVQTWQDVYVFDRATAKMLNSIPEIPPDSEPVVFTYRDYPFDRPTNLWYEWVAILASTIKCVELCTLWAHGDLVLCWVSSLSWLYFFTSSVVLQFSREWQRNRRDSANDEIDLVAGQLPTTKRPGGPRRILLGRSENDRMLLPWEVAWGVGILISVASVVTTYVFVSTASNTTFYTWAAFQFAWLLLSLLFSYFTDAIDPLTHRRLLAQVSKKDLTRDDKDRLLGLAFSVARYQMYFHPRGIYCYDEELLCTRTLSDYLYQVGHRLEATYPLDPSAQPGDTVDITVVAIVGDPTLTSVAWLQGSSPTRSGMDLYDSCIVFARVGGGRLVAVPAARVLSDPLTSAVDVEASGNVVLDRDIVQKGSTNTGSGISWWYWIPCGPDRWLQARTEDMRFLGTRTADVLADAGVTDKLERGRLVVSLKHVADVKGVVALSAEAGGWLLDVAR